MLQNPEQTVCCLCLVYCCLMGGAMVGIMHADVTDAAEILALQRLAYQSEAALYGDWSIPPLCQTLDQMQQDLQSMTVLKACDGKIIVGSVRGLVRDGRCELGRLIVHPDCQGKGIGSGLVRALESALPQVTRFELFTGSRSEANIRLYQRLGYSAFDRKCLSASVELVMLEKIRL